MLSEKIKIAGFACLLALMTGLPQQAVATNLNISQNPLFLATSVEPNLMFIIDDSGSMMWETMPDGLTNSLFANPAINQRLFWLFPAVFNLHGDEYMGSGNNNFGRIPFFRLDDGGNVSNLAARTRSAAVNTIYYNPAVTYTPWVEEDGTPFPPAPPTAAPNRPLFDGTVPGNTDLGTRNLTADASHNRWWRDDSSTTNNNVTYFPATYYFFNGGDEMDAANYTHVEIRPTNAPFQGHGRQARTDCANAGATPPSCSYDEEIQNFANWYSYYRSRIFASRAGIGQTFADFDGGMRVGFGAINYRRTSTGTLDGVSGSRTVIRGVRPFTGSDKSDFFEELYTRSIPADGTPLRRALDAVGQYFSRTDERGPWSTTPGETGGEDLTCRQSFSILMTDGFATGGSGWDATDAARRANTDGSTSGNTTNVHPDNPASNWTYTPIDPFQDGRSNTIADVAMYYWKRDLRPDLDNRVPTSNRNEAFWQHMVTYGVGLGVQGAIDPDDARQAVIDGTPIAWPDPEYGSVNCSGANCGARIDDLLHAGINSRGGFFSVADPESFRRELRLVIADIIARAAATTGVAVSATRLTTDAFVYTGDFDSENWTGQLRALDPEDGDVEWSASDELESLGAASRNIFSYDPDDETGIEFTAGTTDIADRLMDPAPSGGDWTFANLVNYLRGSAALEERNGGTFRDRDSLLGDIVNSRPVFSGRGNEGWAREYADYIDYIDGPKQDPRDCGSPCNKRETVFIGANGGMLHAFDGRNGVEHFAYVPAAVHENLHELADPAYSHRFFADGQITIADARIGGGAQPWRTVLVGGLGAGGRGIYALDVTEPQNFNQSKVLWEFTHEDDPDLGFTFGEPLIARLENGDWVAIFGNGYNSQDNQAYLFVLDLDTGDLRNKIALGNPGGNGLSGVVGWRDVATRTSLERVYAGDLNGTVWRVDFTSSSPSVKYSDGLFTDPNGRAITATPNLAAHPSGGLVVYFGTGKLIENSDRLETEMERFYALRDRGSAVGNNNPAMNQFAEAEIATAAAIPGQPPLRTVVNTDGIKSNGWFVDLATGAASGERVLAPPRVVFGRVVVASYEPVEDPCRPGGVQRTYVLDALSGDGALPFCPGCGAVEIGSGAPFSPPIAIRPQQPGTGTDVTFPGHVDPEDPQPFPLPPDPTGDQTTRGWCSEFGIPPLFQGGSFLSLGTICEGRQVWRQVR